MAISTAEHVEASDEPAGQGSYPDRPQADQHHTGNSVRLNRVIPAGLAVIGALIYAIGRSLRDDFTGGIIEFLEWGALGALIVGGVALVVANQLATGRSIDVVKAIVLSLATVAISWFILSNATDMDRLASTIRVVFIAVVVVGGLWIGLNQLFNLASVNWTVFVGVSASLVAAVAFGVARGNRVIRSLVFIEDDAELGAAAGLLGRIEWPIYGVIVFGGGMAVMSLISSRAVRILIGAFLGAGTGWLIGANLQVWQRPDINWLAVIVAVLVAAVVFVLPTMPNLRPLPGAITGAFVGVVIGAWFLSPFHELITDEALFDARIAAALPLALLGVRLGMVARPSVSEIARMDSRARAFIFLGPALLFLFATLVVPAVRTIVLSFKDRDSVEFVGFDNYETLLNDEGTFDFSAWADFFTSQLFWVGGFVLIVGLAVGFVTGQRRNNEFSFVQTGSALAPIAIGVLLLVFAVLSVLRGTFFNNLWWVITVTTMSTVLGLTIAVLSERAGRFESVAKSLIFMPMAVSFVGASIVWRLQYQPRDPTNEQTGVLNAVWVGLGKLSRAGEPGNTYPAAWRWIVVVALGLIAAVIAIRAVARFRERATFSLHVGGIIVVGYLFVELLRRSLGGFSIDPVNGSISPDTILFLQEVRPFNNLFLMIILIWIQTGFAMVILAAAIKAVPQEFIEAARVDGATEGQTFFNVTLPQIVPTIGVVVTTLIVLVTKVFDIVEVTTGGNFGTNLLANDMISVSFNFFNTGLGSAIAVFILILVLPVMIFNVGRMQKARVSA